MDELREACAAVARRASAVTVVTEAIAPYAADLRAPVPDRFQAQASPAGPARAPRDETEREARAAYWLTMDAINFGSGWFPTLRKRDGLSGYRTIAAALRDRFDSERGGWSASELSEMNAPTLGPVLGQDPTHELMALYATSLRDLGTHVAADHGASFAAVADTAAGSAVALARQLGRWSCFEDCSRYSELEIPFLKRAQIAAADLHRAGVSRFADLDRLTMFADNLVPHVLRLDGVLHFDAGLVARIEREELIPHGSKEEVEIRACAVHAVELLVAASPQPDVCAAAVDQVLWGRGQGPRYKASPRHRSRCTAY